jgi:hypothetical protein
MSTATVLAPARDAIAFRTEDAAIARAEAILRQADAGVWTGEAAKAVSEAATAVRDAIEMHRLIRAGSLSWEMYDTDLAVYADPEDVAKTKSAEEAEDAAGWLAEVIGKYGKGEQ